VDSSYKVIATLPGGVAAAFSKRGDGVAILSATGTDTTINFAGAFAPAALKLQGSPRAITALKEGGYLVLVQIAGQGRVVKISPDGRSEGSVSTASVVGGDLLYDEATNFFTVTNGGSVSTAQGPASAAAAASSVTPASVATTVAAPSASATSAPTTAATSSPAPEKSPSPSPVVAILATRSVLDDAKSIGSGVYSASLPSGLKPHLMAASGSRVWFVDQASRVGTFDMTTGEVKTIGKLRSDAHVAYWVAGRSFVFGVDDATGQVHVVNTVTESIDSYPLNVLSPVSAVAIGPGDRLWVALRDASYLLAFDPRTHGIDAFDLGDAGVNALAVDSLGRVVYSDDLHARVGTLDLTTMKINGVVLNRRGSTTALIVDGSGTLWLGTSTGDIYSVKGGSARLMLNVRMPVSALSLDDAGRAWFLAPIPNGIPGFAYGSADGSQAVRSIPGPAQGLAFNETGRAFSSDPRGAFYVALADSR
jgi:streptogramin lyase